MQQANENHYSPLLFEAGRDANMGTTGFNLILVQENLIKSNYASFKKVSQLFPLPFLLRRLTKAHTAHTNFQSPHREQMKYNSILWACEWLNMNSCHTLFFDLS